jgi:hypothetical protein
MAWVHELTVPTERPLLVGEVNIKFVDRECHVVSVTDPDGRNLDFLDQTHYIFFQVAPQLYSWGWVYPVPYPLLLRKSGSAGNRTQASGSVARNSDNWTTEAVDQVRLYPLLFLLSSKKCRRIWSLKHGALQSERLVRTQLLVSSQLSIIINLLISSNHCIRLTSVPLLIFY